MKGTRPLDNTEIRLVSACFDGTFEVRNRGLFMLGVSPGGRISKLLSLTISDVYQKRRAVTDLLFDKQVRHRADAPANRTRHPQDRFHRGGVERTHRDAFTAEVLCTAIV